MPTLIDELLPVREVAQHHAHIARHRKNTWSGIAWVAVITLAWLR